MCATGRTGAEPEILALSLVHFGRKLFVILSFVHEEKYEAAASNKFVELYFRDECKYFRIENWNNNTVHFRP